MNSNLNFELGRFATGRYRNRSGPVTPITAVSGPVPVGKKTLARMNKAMLVLFSSYGQQLEHFISTQRRHVWYICFVLEIFSIKLVLIKIFSLSCDLDKLLHFIDGLTNIYAYLLFVSTYIN